MDVKLPYHENAYVPAAKLTEYLLSETHPVGKSKARFFREVGFDDTNPDALEQALLEIPRKEDVAETVTSVYGTKFIVEGMLNTPARGPLPLRTVWILEPGDDRPRFVTAYPR